MLVHTVRALAWIWLFAACSLILGGYASTWHQQGFSALWKLLGPQNVVNLIAVGCTLAPAYFFHKLAGGIQEKNRGKILRATGALLISVIAVALISLLPVMLEGNNSKHARENGKAREYEAQLIRVKDHSATMYHYKDNLMTTSSGSAGGGGIPETVQIGDTITVDGNTIRVTHILVKEILSDTNYGGQVLGKTGDTQCVVVESLENLPYVDNSAAREHLWIMVENCVPIAVAPQ